MQKENLQRRLNGIERTLRNQVIFNRAVLTVNEAPSYLGITKKHLNDLIRLKAIPFHTRFGHIYFKRAELDSWMVGEKCKWLTLGAVLQQFLKLVPWLSILIKFLWPISGAPTITTEN